MILCVDSIFPSISSELRFRSCLGKDYRQRPLMILCADSIDRQRAESCLGKDLRLPVIHIISFLSPSRKLPSTSFCTSTSCKQRGSTSFPVEASNPNHLNFTAHWSVLTLLSSLPQRHKHKTPAYVFFILFYFLPLLHSTPPCAAFTSRSGAGITFSHTHKPRGTPKPAHQHQPSLTPIISLLGSELQ